MRTAKLTILSDREQALCIVVDEPFPHGYRGYCAQHMAENVKTRYGLAARQAFWKIVKARSLPAYNSALGELNDVKPAAFTYVKAISPQLYAACSFPRPRFGCITSNIVESANALYLHERSLPVVEMITSIWHKEMHWRFLHLQNAQAMHPAQRFTPWAATLPRRSERFANGFDVAMRDEDSGLVFKDGRQWIVDLRAMTCSCLRFQDTGVPCGHAIRVIYAIRRNPREYMPTALTIDSWIRTYSLGNLPLIDRNALLRLKQTQVEMGGNFPAVAALETPMTAKPRGRPTVQRKRRVI
jgi:hypothetical protein